MFGNLFWIFCGPPLARVCSSGAFRAIPCRKTCSRISFKLWGQFSRGSQLSWKVYSYSLSRVDVGCAAIDNCLGWSGSLESLQVPAANLLLYYTILAPVILAVVYECMCQYEPLHIDVTFRLRASRRPTSTLQDGLRPPSSIAPLNPNVNFVNAWKGTLAVGVAQAERDLSQSNGEDGQRPQLPPRSHSLPMRAGVVASFISTQAFARRITFRRLLLHLAILYALRPGPWLGCLRTTNSAPAIFICTMQPGRWRL